MDDLLSEKEQIEKMRAWWSDYGWYVIGGIVLGAVILLGINYYRAQTVKTEVAASMLYDEITQHVLDGDLEAFPHLGERPKWITFGVEHGQSHRLERQLGRTDRRVLRLQHILQGSGTAGVAGHCSGGIQIAHVGRPDHVTADSAPAAYENEP